MSQLSSIRGASTDRFNLRAGHGFVAWLGWLRPKARPQATTGQGQWPGLARLYLARLGWLFGLSQAMATTTEKRGFNEISFTWSTGSPLRGRVQELRNIYQVTAPLIGVLCP